jgi:DNA polymerase-1
VGLTGVENHELSVWGGALREFALVGHNLHRAIVNGQIEMPDPEHRVFDTAIGSMLMDGGKRGPGYCDVAARVGKHGASALPELVGMLEHLLQERGLVRVANLEFEALGAIATMERAGLHLDVPRLALLLHDLEPRRDVSRDQAVRMLGVSNLEDQRSIHARLEQMLGVPLERTRREEIGAYATHPAVRALLDFRKLDALAKYAADFAERIGVDGRVRCRIDQLGAATGRMSASGANLMGIPRDPNLRRCVIAPTGHVLIDADYAAVDLRVVAHVAGDARLVNLFRQGADPHEATAAVLLRKSTVTSEERRLGKPFNFKAIYGGGPDAIAAYANTSCGLSLDREQASALLRGFFAAYPGVAEWQRRMREQSPVAVRTMSGRIQFFEGGGDDHCARLAHEGQGTAADGMKRSLALMFGELDRFGARVVLTVHDSALVESPTEHAGAVADLIESCMQRGMSEFIPTVPVVVDVKIGSNWADMESARSWRPR